MTRIAVATMLASAALTGCKKEEPTPTIPPVPARSDTNPAVAPAKPMTGAATLPAVTLPATSLPSSVSGPVNSAVANLDPAKATAAKDAQAKLSEVAQLIGDKKYDLADAALKKLEENKASLPEMAQSKLPDLRKSLDAAKALNGASKLPDVPKVPSVPDLNK